MRQMLFVDRDSLIFDQPGLSTLRKGDKWADLAIGEKIELAHKAEDGTITPVGAAEVRGVVKDQLGAIIATLSLSNHGCVCIGITDQDEARDHLEGIMELCYGAVDLNETYTAVFLRWDPTTL